MPRGLGPTPAEVAADGCRSGQAGSMRVEPVQSTVGLAADINLARLLVGLGREKTSGDNGRGDSAGSPVHLGGMARGRW